MGSIAKSEIDTFLSERNATSGDILEYADAETGDSRWGIVVDRTDGFFDILPFSVSYFEDKRKYFPVRVFRARPPDFRPQVLRSALEELHDQMALRRVK